MFDVVISISECQQADLTMNPNSEYKFEMFFERGYQAFTADNNDAGNCGKDSSRCCYRQTGFGSPLPPVSIMAVTISAFPIKRFHRWR